MKVAIFGASGLVGAAVHQRLSQRPDMTVKPLVFSGGGAWRLARYGFALTSVDLLSREQIRDVLRDCSHVVNCARGPLDRMVPGLRNLLEECQAAGVQRFVHLSSVAVYGDPPTPESARETAPTEPEKGSYGWYKLAQDRLVSKARDKGLEGVVLCPPNISGPFSYYALQILALLKTGRFALMDGGEAPCNLVDVQNLAYAVELVLDSKASAKRERYFVTDDEATTWREFIEGLAPCLGPDLPLPEISRAELQTLARPNGVAKGSLGRTIKHLVSSDVRAALRQDPLLAKLDRAVRGSIAMLPSALEDKLRLSIEGPLPIPRVGEVPPFDPRLCGQQLRGVRHSCDALKQDFGYRPVVSFEESTSIFRQWYERLHGVEGPQLSLLRELWPNGARN